MLDIQKRVILQVILNKGMFPYSRSAFAHELTINANFASTIILLNKTLSC